MKGQVVAYGLTGLAEAELRREDVPIEPAVDELLELPFDAGCNMSVVENATVGCRSEDCYDRCGDHQALQGGP